MRLFDDANSSEYVPYRFANEAEFERVVVKLSERIFGPDSVYFDVKKKVKGKEIVSIPDGYLIDYADPKRPNLYIVENEISRHDAFKHIGIQLLRFSVSFEEARVDLWDVLMKEIQAAPAVLTKLEAAAHAGGLRNVDDLLNAAVYAPFKSLVLIDEIQPELKKVLEKINAEITPLEVKAFQSSDGKLIYQFDTLYDEEIGVAVEHEDSIKVSSPENRKGLIQKLSQADTIIVPAREEGFKRVFLGENRWYEIRVGAAMRDRIKWIAAYQVAPISAITHIAKVLEIKPFESTGKYQLIFDGPAQAIEAIKLGDSKRVPYGPVYAEHEKLKRAKFFDEIFSS